MQVELRAGQVSSCRYASPNCQAHCAASDSVAGDEVIVSIAGHVSRDSHCHHEFLTDIFQRPRR
jgi:hypothetical protein